MLTFRSGGWVILIALIMTAILTIWAILPAIAGFSQRPPGQRGNVSSFLFDLDHALVDIDDLHAPQAHRDLLKSMTDPDAMPGNEMARFNALQRGKYVVPMDRVLGVTINGASRAYPIHVLEAHEIINDTLGGVAIAITYNPPSGTAIVFERSIAGQIIEFGVSGLVLDSNLLMYHRHADPTAEPGGESLWSQLLGKAITGSDAQQGLTLRPVSCAITLWHQWLTEHPGTTVVKRDQTALKRYKQFNYDQYYQTDELVDGVAPLPPDDSEHQLKEPMIILGEGQAARVFSLESLQQQAAKETSIMQLQLTDDLILDVHCTADPLTCHIVAAHDASGNEVQPPLVRYTLWFAWYASQHSE